VAWNCLPRRDLPGSRPEFLPAGDVYRRVSFKT
jgi:hypothetical protein